MRPLSYLYHPWFAISLSPASHIDSITKETVARHPSTNNTSDHWTRVYTYPHLEEGEEERERKGGRKRGEREKREKDIRVAKKRKEKEREEEEESKPVKT